MPTKTVYLNDQQHRDTKIYSALVGTTIIDVVSEALKLYAAIGKPFMNNRQSLPPITNEQLAELSDLLARTNCTPDNCIETIITYLRMGIE